MCSNGACTTTCGQGQLTCSVNGAPTCVDPRTNPTFCGATGDCKGGNVGVTCPGGTVCTGGACKTTCSSGQVNCNGVCVDPLTDNTYCGVNAGCFGGQTCPPGQVCSAGQCSTTCAPTQALCNGQCVDPKTSPSNCGAAPGGSCSSATSGDPNYQGQACGPLTQCGAPAGSSTYTCRSTCTGGGTQCFPPVGTPYCANTNSDNNNCGSCGHQCGALEACDGTGHCASTCAGGQSPCPGASSPNPTTPYCANLQTDNGNCGTCNHACGSPLLCSGGSCGSICGAGQTLCTQTGAPYCAVTQTDVKNCGGCGSVCGGACVKSTCCPAGSTDVCSGTCSNTSADPSNCGTCGNVCPASTPLCVGGQCAATLYGIADLFAPKKLVFLFVPAGTSFSSNADYAAMCAAHGFTQNQNFQNVPEFVNANMYDPNNFYCGGYCCYLGNGDGRALNFLSFENHGLPLDTELQVFDRGCGDYAGDPPNQWPAGGSFNIGLNTTDALFVTGATTETYNADYYGPKNYGSPKTTTLSADGVIVCQTN